MFFFPFKAEVFHFVTAIKYNTPQVQLMSLVWTKAKKLLQNPTFWVSSNNSFSSLLNSLPTHPFLHLLSVTIVFLNWLISLGRCISFRALAFQNFVPTCSCYIYHSSSVAWPSFYFQHDFFLCLRFMHSSCFTQADLLPHFLSFLHSRILYTCGCIFCSCAYYFLGSNASIVFLFKYGLAYWLWEFVEIYLLWLSCCFSFLPWMIMIFFFSWTLLMDSLRQAQIFIHSSQSSRNIV